METAEQIGVRSLWSSLSRNIKSLRLRGFVMLQDLVLSAEGELYVEQHYTSAHLSFDPSHGDFAPALARWWIQVPLQAKPPIQERLEASIRTARGRFSGTVLLAEAESYGLRLVGTDKLRGLEESGLFPPPPLTDAEILSARCGY